MNQEIVSTERFYELMHDARFIRLEIHRGQMCGTRYYVTESPEEAGMMDELPQQIIDSLGFKYTFGSKAMTRLAALLKNW